jgi:hypothetical protein
MTGTNIIRNTRIQEKLILWNINLLIGNNINSNIILKVILDKSQVLQLFKVFNQ